MSKSERFFAHADNCERCQRYFLSWSVCPEAEALLATLAKETAEAIFPIPVPAAKA